MRELTLEEIEQVSGGGTLGDFAADGGAAGTVLGGFFTDTLGGAARGGIGGAALGASFGLGYMAGTYLYERVS